MEEEITGEFLEKVFVDKLLDDRIVQTVPGLTINTLKKKKSKVIILVGTAHSHIP